jgi:o-succinylbenzoate synthase
MSGMRVQLFRYDLPLTRPIVLPERELERRRGFLLRIEDGDGYAAYGDAAPLPGFSVESEDDVIAAARILASKVAGERAEVQYLLKLRSRLSSALPASLYFAANWAFQCLIAHKQRKHPIHLVSVRPPETIYINGLLTGDAGSIASRARALREEGFRAAKLKVGRRPLDEDVERIVAARETLGPDVALRLDANRAWTLEEALTITKKVTGLNIEYVEEPLQSWQELPEFSEKSGLGYALDETLVEQSRIEEDASWKDLAHVSEGAAAIVSKPTLLGSLFSLSRPCVISACFESGVGIAALVNFAAAYGDDTPAGLDTYGWLAEDVLEDRLPFNNGAIDVAAATPANLRIRHDMLEEIPL